MINKIIRNFIAKQVAGRTDDGIMITLKDPKKVEFQTAMMQDLLMRRGIDPNAIQSEAQLKMIINQIKAMEKAEDAAQAGIRNTESAKVFDLKGKRIKDTDNIMGGEEVGMFDNIFNRMQNEMKGLRSTDDLPPKGSRGGADDIAAPVQSAEESLRNMNLDELADISADIKTNIEKRNKDSIKRILERKNREDVYGLEDYDTTNMSEIKKEIIRTETKLGNLNPNSPDFREKAKALSDRIIALKNKMREDKAGGGRIGFFLGSKLPKGLATLRTMLNYMGKKSDVVKKPSDVLKMVNPKSLNKMLEDPRLQGKVNIKEGILASDSVKGFQSKMGEDRIQLVKDMLSAAKNIKRSDDKILTYKNEIKERMMKDLNMSEAEADRAATAMSRLAMDITKMPDTPKLTDEGILQLENVLKNMETGGKKKRDLNADGGRIGLKDGMNRRTFLKLLTGLAAVPIIGKVLKPLKVGKKVTQVPIIKTGDVPGKPEWFDQLVNKVILEGDEVTKRFATQERQIVHMKKIDDETSVTVTQDLNDGSIMVDVDDPIRNVMGQSGDDTSVQMMLKKNPGDESNPAGPDEFSFTEADMRNYMDGPDDYITEFTENTVNKMSDLTSDLGKIKSYATGKKPTMKEFIESKKRQDKVRFAEEKPAEYAAERGPDIDYSDYEYASGGIARMLGE